MNWFQQNRWLGTFLIVLGVSTLASGYFLFSAKGGADEALARFNEAAAERARLERLDPFPTEANYQKMKVHLQDYAASLDKLKEDLKTRVMPLPPMAPNEFQSHLRQAMLTVGEKARANRVKLPDNFALGFEEFTAGLPSTAAAPLLGQELAQVELLLDTLIDARVDAVTAVTRTPLAEERPPAPAANAPGARKPPGPAVAVPKMIERGVIDVAFTSSPSAARKVLNQWGSASRQFYIIRTLHVLNEKEKAPVREASPAPGATPAAAAAGKNAALTFIVGGEHIETSARVELVRFNF
ncbi:MAG TPA: Amuc_1100 family pilus-like protein [Chthoniobacterales bacterium]